MMKLKKMFVATATLSLLMATTVLAGTWKNGEEPNQNKWWYDNGNGTYASNGWQWIDGNGDGIAECYYFDEAGWLLTDTITPDGCLINKDGAWVQDGEVQTKAVNLTVEPLNLYDFVVSGDNSITREIADHSFVTKTANATGAGIWQMHTFVPGDSIVTARGISWGNTKTNVIEKYGNTNMNTFIMDKWYQRGISGVYTVNDTNTILATSASYAEYTVNQYGIRFYFDAQEVLSGIMYIKEE